MPEAKQENFTVEQTNQKVLEELLKWYQGKNKHVHSTINYHQQGSPKQPHFALHNTMQYSLMKKINT